MIADDFTKHAMRLYTEWGKGDEFTPDRLRILHERFGHLPLEVWVHAVDTAIIEPTFPFPKRLQNLVAESQEWIAEQEADRRRREAKALLSGGVPEILSAIPVSDTFGAKCKALCQSILTNGWTPTRAAEWLRDACDENLVMGGMDCSLWIGYLEKSGEYWRGVPVGPVMVRPARQSRQMVAGDWS